MFKKRPGADELISLRQAAIISDLSPSFLISEKVFSKIFFEITLIFSGIFGMNVDNPH